MPGEDPVSKYRGFRTVCRRLSGARFAKTLKGHSTQSFTNCLLANAMPDVSMMFFLE